MRVSAAVLVLLAGCKLPANVFYQCELDGGCAVRGTVCMSDGVCRPPDGGGERDAGSTDAGPPDAGGCVPLPLATACAAVECGFVQDGCGHELDCDKRCADAMECGVRTPNTCALPSLCTAEGWCWENPLPQGLTLNAAFRLDARHTWFVGEGNVILHFDGERSSLQTPSGLPRGQLAAIHGTALDEVFAVGANGMILHFDGRRWEREGVAGGFTVHLGAVWSLGGGRALAVGPAGKVLSRDPGAAIGARWAVQTLTTSTAGGDLRAVVATPAGRQFFVNTANELFSRVPGEAGWASLGFVPLAATTAMMPVGDEVLFGGRSMRAEAVVKRLADGTWQVMLDGGTTAVTQLVRGDGGVFVLGAPDFAWLADDGSSAHLEAPSAQWNTGAALEGPRLFAAGRFGGMGVLSLDGGVVRTGPPVLRGVDLNAVCGFEPGALKAAGGADTTLTTDCPVAGCVVSWLERAETPAGVRWEKQTHHLGNTLDLLGCFSESANRAWLVGNDTKFISWDVTGPHAGDFTGDHRGAYSGAWGSPLTGYHFVTTDSSLLTVSSDGLGAFSAMDAGATAGLLSVWGLSPSDVMVVGRSGQVSRFNGQAWTNSTLVADDLVSVHGAQQTGGSRYVAVGGSRTVSFVDRLVPTLDDVGAGVTLRSVWVSRHGQAWAVGSSDAGAAVFVGQPSAPWQAVPLDSPRSLRGVFGFDWPDGGSSVWVVGPGGLVLRRDGP